MVNQYEIKVDYNDEKSVKKAEKQKSLYENKGLIYDRTEQKGVDKFNIYYKESPYEKDGSFKDSSVVTPYSYKRKKVEVTREKSNSGVEVSYKPVNYVRGKK